MKEADCHNNFENTILSVTINFSPAQALHITETQNSTIKLKAIAKGWRLETLSISKLTNTCCKSPHSGNVRKKAREDREIKPMKMSYS